VAKRLIFSLKPMHAFPRHFPAICGARLSQPEHVAKPAGGEIYPPGFDGAMAGEDLHPGLVSRLGQPRSAAKPR